MLGASATQRFTTIALPAAPDLLALSATSGLTAPAVLTVRGWQLLVANPVERISSLTDLSRFAEAVGWRGDPPAGVPFQGGAVGFLTSDLSNALLQLPPDGRPSAAPDVGVAFGVHDWAVAIGPDGDAWVVAPEHRAEDLAAWAVQPAHSPAVVPVASDPQPRLSTSREGHAAAVRRILEWIAAGDLYQANLTLQIAAAWDAGPQELARRLWAATPGAAHAAMVVVDDDTAIVSASPETFLRVDGDAVTTRPIKGTRRRSWNLDEDRAQADALRASEKDHAEHLMIVDLERNDLGRVCEAGSITVDEYAAVEPHPTVWHLTSTVSGRLRNDVGLDTLLAATFPSGSVTGAPKRMAVARIGLVEPVRRGVYCGAVGMIGPGIVDLSVAIRTAVLTGGVASYGAGGGIVADSDPDAEFSELLDKAAAFFTATGTQRP